MLSLMRFQASLVLIWLRLLFSALLFSLLEWNSFADDVKGESIECLMRLLWEVCGLVHAGDKSGLFTGWWGHVWRCWRSTDWDWWFGAVLSRVMGLGRGSLSYQTFGDVCLLLG